MIRSDVLDSRLKDLSPVAWCCAHFPATCGSYGFADTEIGAWFATWDHWKLVHR